MSQGLKNLLIYFAAAMPVGLGLIWIAKRISPNPDNDYLTILPATLVAIFVGFAAKDRFGGDGEKEREK